MSAFLPSPSAWPFPVGQGPFMVKGTVYRGHLEYVASELSGGVPRMCSLFEDPALARYFEQTFLASTLYDLYPLVMAAAPSATMAGVSAVEFVEMRSRIQAPKDLHGVYRFLVSMVPSRTVARRIPQLFAQLFNFGETRIVRDEPGEIEVVFDGIPQAFAPWFGTVVCAYGESAMRTSGAEHGEFTLHPPVSSSMHPPGPAGVRSVPTSRVRIGIRWRGPER